jgi:hypothetical protein
LTVYSINPLDFNERLEKKIVDTKVSLIERTHGDICSHLTSQSERNISQVCLTILQIKKLNIYNVIYLFQFSTLLLCRLCVYMSIYTVSSHSEYVVHFFFFRKIKKGDK